MPCRGHKKNVSEWYINRIDKGLDLIGVKLRPYNKRALYMKLSQILSLTIAMIVTASSAYAQTSSTGALPDGTSVVQVNPEVKEDDKAFSVDVGIEMSQKIIREENTEQENSTSVVVAPSYKLNSLLTLAAKGVFNQDNYGQRESSVADTKISLGIAGYEFTPNFKSTHAVSSVVPTSRKSIEDDRLKGNISTTNGIAFSNDYFLASYAIGIGRNFHEFTQNRERSPNVQYRLSQIVEIKVPITEQFMISGSGVYRMGRTYEGADRYDFIFDADLNYEFIKSLTANVGTSNEGAALKANGTTSNIAAWDDKSSVVRGGLTYSY